MEPKEMRVKLKAAGITCPVSNKDVTTRYEENFGNGKTPESTIEVAAVNLDTGKEIPTIVELVSDNIYTYVGFGDEPPHIINFMGLQRFIRGKAVKVTRSEVLAKIVNNRCFIRGEVDQEVMDRSDEKAKGKAEAQRKTDNVTNLEALRQRA